MEEKNLTPTQYFLEVKNKLKERNHKQLDEVIKNANILAKKCIQTGQEKQLKKLIFLLETADKERLLLDKGISKYVMSEDVLNYIDNVAKKIVKIIELKNYPREIPDKIAETIEDVSGLFGELYVVFTDYTGEIEKQVEKERRDKDPILFGSFQDKEGNISNKWYFLGDWIDEYCDLTLEKMVNEMKIEKDIDIVKKASFPSLQEMKEVCYGTPKNKQTFFQKVRTFFHV